MRETITTNKDTGNAFALDLGSGVGTRNLGRFGDALATDVNGPIWWAMPNAPGMGRLAYSPTTCQQRTHGWPTWARMKAKVPLRSAGARWWEQPLCTVERMPRPGPCSPQGLLLQLQLQLRTTAVAEDAKAATVTVTRAGDPTPSVSARYATRALEPCVAATRGAAMTRSVGRCPEQPARDPRVDVTTWRGARHGVSQPPRVISWPGGVWPPHRRPRWTRPPPPVFG